MPDARILVVEDASIIAMDAQTSLEELGYTVVGIAASKEVAIQLATETLPDLALMDIKLGQDDSAR